MRGKGEWTSACGAGVAGHSADAGVGRAGRVGGLSRRAGGKLGHAGCGPARWCGAGRRDRPPVGASVGKKKERLG